MLLPATLTENDLSLLADRYREVKADGKPLIAYKKMLDEINSGV